MSVKIGKTYYIKVAATQLMDLIPHSVASDDLRANYPFMIDVVGKPVVLTAIHPGWGEPGDPWYTEDTGVVTLGGHASNFWLHIKTKFLYEKPTLDQCTCKLSTLMCAGCKCGAMKKSKP